MKPKTSAEEVIEVVMTAITAFGDKENILLAGDLTCRIDKDNTKTQLVLESLEEQGFTLATERDTPTYIAPNGTSTIDLLFYKRETHKNSGAEGPMVLRYNTAKETCTYGDNN